jgi:hypothetical protein
LYLDINEFKFARLRCPVLIMSPQPSPAMMRIAIAGGGGFANILAQQLAQSAHALIVLSTRVGLLPLSRNSTL